MVDLYTGDGLDERVDVWALGCFLYMLCFFVHPFATAGNLGILSVKCAIDSVLCTLHPCQCPTSSRRPCRYRMPADTHFSPELKEIITRCLVAHPRDRPTSATILRYSEELQVRARIPCASGTTPCTHILWHVTPQRGCKGSELPPLSPSEGGCGVPPVPPPRMSVPVVVPAPAPSPIVSAAAVTASTTPIPM